MPRTQVTPPSAAAEGPFIGSTWRTPSGPSRLEVVSPVDETLIATLPCATSDDIDIAVAAARQVHDGGQWRRLPPHERASALDRIAQRLAARRHELSAIVTAELGSPRAQSERMVQRAEEIWRSNAEHARSFAFEERRDGTTVRHEPTGVAGAIIPFNGVLPQAAWKIGAALAAGCPVVLKTAPVGALSASKLAEIVEEAGLPAGVVSILAGGIEPGKRLVDHPDVDAVSFTGGVESGKSIMRAAAGTLKRVKLELGGKSPGIAADDADPQLVVASAVAGALSNAGQVCSALTRLLVPASQHDDYVDALRQAFSDVVAGDPWDPVTTLGPLATKEHRDRVAQHISAGKADGATLVTGGQPPAGRARGWFLEPTLFAHVDNRSYIARHEVFGPVLSVIAYNGLDEAITLANDTPFGLAAYVFTRDEATAWHVAENVRAGQIAWNSPATCVTQPFGGFKQSGFGREGGLEGLTSFLETKTVIATRSPAA